MSITLKGDNFSRNRAIFAVTFTYRAQAPRQRDWAGDAVGGIEYEKGITTRTLHVLSPSAELAKTAVIEERGRHCKDFVFERIEESPVQLDFVIEAGSGLTY